MYFLDAIAHAQCCSIANCGGCLTEDTCTANPYEEQSNTGCLWRQDTGTCEEVQCAFALDGGAHLTPGFQIESGNWAGGAAWITINTCTCRTPLLNVNSAPIGIGGHGVDSEKQELAINGISQGLFFGVGDESCSMMPVPVAQGIDVSSFTNGGQPLVLQVFNPLADCSADCGVSIRAQITLTGCDDARVVSACGDDCGTGCSAAAASPCP